MPVLHLLAGPNGAGKSTFVDDVLLPATGLPFINADVIAAERWPGSQAEHAYDASQIAEAQRRSAMAVGQSFVSETVFSHRSKVQLVCDASTLGYLVTLHVIVVPIDLSVQRVAERVRRGGHAVPENKIRERYGRIWPLVAEAARVADEVHFYDNSDARHPYRTCAAMIHGTIVGQPDWPRWAPRGLAEGLTKTVES